MAIHCEHVKNYINLVEKNEIIVSKEVKLLIENEVKPLVESDSPHIFYDEKKYNECINYIERFYFELFPYQKFLIFFHFLYEKIDDFMVLYYNEYFYLMGRGNGKDGLIGPLINYFQTSAFGILNYNIDIVANSEIQSKGTFEVPYDMMKQPKFFPMMKHNFIINKEEITHRVTNSTLTYNTSNGKTKDGKRPGCIVLNEVHAYENYDQINVHTSGLGKVEYPRTIIITTNGEVRDGPLDDYVQTALEKLDGLHPRLRLFPFICRLESDDNYMDLDILQKSNPSLIYRPTLKNQIEDDLIKMPTKPSMLNEFLSKRCNLTRNSADKAIVDWEYIKACTRDLPDLDGLTCVIGIDYASFRDFVSVGCLFYVDNEWVFTQHSFVCTSSPTFNQIKFDLNLAEEQGELTFCHGEMINDDVVSDYIELLKTKYNVIAVACDSFRYSMVKKLLFELGFDEKSKTNPYGRIQLVRSGVITHTLLFPEIEKAFVKGDINFGNSRMMRWYTNNVKKVHAGKGNVFFDKINAETRKTDGFSAFVHAFSLRELLEKQTTNTAPQVFRIT